MVFFCFVLFSYLKKKKKSKSHPSCLPAVAPLSALFSTSCFSCQTTGKLFVFAPTSHFHSLWGALHNITGLCPVETTGCMEALWHVFYL